jgi:DNA polymerase-1
VCPWNVDVPDAEWWTSDDPGIESLIREVDDLDILAIDTETTGLDQVNDVPLFWSLSWGERRICMPAETLHLFKTILKDPGKKWVGANIKYDQHILANVGMQLSGELIDTQVMHALLYEDEPHRLKYMAERLLKWTWTDFGDTFNFNKAGKLSLDSTPAEIQKGGAFKSVQDAIMWCYHNDLPKLVDYAANDAYGTMKVYHKLKEELEGARIHSLYPTNLATLSDYFFNLEVPFTRVLWQCERHGIKIDSDYLNHIKEPVEQTLAQLEKDIVRLAGRPINPGSNKDVQTYFFKELGLVPKKLTKGGRSGVKQAAVDFEVIEELADENPVAKALLEYRELSKLSTTYVNGLRSHMDVHGRIHCRLNQDIVRTGRLSSSGPNLCLN